MFNVCREVPLYMYSSDSQVVQKICNICIDEWGRMCHMHIETDLRMHSMKRVGKTMKTNIRVVDCFALFGAHQHDVIMLIHA